MESCSNQKSVKQIYIYFIFEILQSSHLSRPDLRDPCLFSIFWLGQGVTRVGTLVFVYLCFLFLCFFVLSMVPNQRQLSIVVSDWGSYLDRPFSHLQLWDLVFVWLHVFFARRSCSFIELFINRERYTTLCLDDSYAHSWHSLNQLHAAGMHLN